MARSLVGTRLLGPAVSRSGKPSRNPAHARLLPRLLLVCFCVLVALPGFAADTRIAMLEVKFFRHDYPKDSIDSRLARLEQLVFGASRSGSQSERLARLVTAVPNLDATPAPPEVTALPEVPRRTAAASGQRHSGGTRTPPGTTPKAVPPASSRYPAISAVEARIFGKNFASEPIGARLDRLEEKLFGRISGGNDLSERVDRIKSATGIDIARQPPAGYIVDPDTDAPTSGAPRSPRIGAGSRQSQARTGNAAAGRSGWARPPARRSPALPPPAPPLARRMGPGISTYSYAPGQIRSVAPVPRIAPPISRRHRRQRNWMPGIREWSRDLSPAPASPYVIPRPAPPRLTGLMPHITALELHRFGTTYPGDALAYRLERLERSFYPTSPPMTQAAPVQRVRRLITMLPYASWSADLIAEENAWR